MSLTVINNSYFYATPWDWKALRYLSPHKLDYIPLSQCLDAIYSEFLDIHVIDNHVYVYSKNEMIDLTLSRALHWPF